MSLGRVALIALGTGVAGWVLENTLEQVMAPRGENPPVRYSMNLPGVPLLPVYAAGGAAVALLQPYLATMHPIARALVYGGALTAVETGAGYLERRQGRMSWDYGGSPVDLPHAITWTVLGYGLERVLEGSRV